MFKVSFKENPQFPVKKVQRFNDDRVTVVTLKGVAELPVFLQYYIPRKVFDWTSTLKNVDVEFTMRRMFITVTGKSICSKEDTIDKVFGERLAEARAKKMLYRFMVNLSKQLLRYYFKIIYGFTGITNYKGNSFDCLESAIYKYVGLWERENVHAKTLINDQFNRQSTTKS